MNEIKIQVKSQTRKPLNQKEIIFFNYYRNSDYVFNLQIERNITFILFFDSKHLENNEKNVVEFLNNFDSNLISAGLNTDCYDLVGQNISKDRIVISQFGSKQTSEIPFNGSIREYFLDCVRKCTKTAYDFYLEFSVSELPKLENFLRANNFELVKRKLYQSTT